MLMTLGQAHALLPGSDGKLSAVWAGVRGAAHPWALAALPKDADAAKKAMLR